MVSCILGRAAVLRAGQRTGTPLSELLGFEPSCIAIAVTARPNSLAASTLLSSVFAGGWSLALQSDRPVKSHTLGVNLAPWVFASMPPAATAGSCAFLEHLPHPGALRSGCNCLALAWEPLSSCTMPGGLKSGRLPSNLFYYCFMAFQKDMFFQKTKIWLVFSTTTECGTATPCAPGGKSVSAQPPWPVPRLAGVTAHLHIPWMSTAALRCLDLLGLCMADWCPCICHLQRRLFLKLAR